MKIYIYWLWIERKTTVNLLSPGDSMRNLHETCKAFARSLSKSKARKRQYAAWRFQTSVVLETDTPHAHVSFPLLGLNRLYQCVGIYWNVDFCCFCCCCAIAVNLHLLDHQFSLPRCASARLCCNVEFIAPTFFYPCYCYCFAVWWAVVRLYAMFGQCMRVCVYMRVNCPNERCDF